MAFGANRLLKRLGIVWLAVLLVAGRSVFAQRVQGRIVGPDSNPIEGAVVSAMSLPDSAVERAVSDANGRYSIFLASASGRYLVTVTRQGFALQRREALRAAGDAPLLVDFRMVPLAQVLSAVRTSAQRPRPPRLEQQADFGPGQAGRLSTANSIDRSDGLSGDARGDLTAALAMLPWLTESRDATGALSVSAFGLGSNQNLTTLNGMAIGGGTGAEGTGGVGLPRDGFRLEAVPATYDPGVGGFAGALVSLRFPSGTADRDRTIHYSLDAPGLQSGPAGIPSVGYRQDVISGTARGPISSRHFFNTSFQIDRRTSELASLLDASQSTLAARSISLDSIDRLKEVLNQLQIPLGTRAYTTAQTASAIVRFDFRPSPASRVEAVDVGFSPSDNQVALLIAGGVNRSDALGGLSATPTVGTQSSSWNASADASASSYVFGSILNELQVSGGGMGRRTASPFALPGSAVLLQSSLPSGLVGLSTVRVGGGGATPSSTNDWSLEIKDQLAWYSWNRQHLLKISIDGAISGHRVSSGHGYGDFVFDSLGALEKNAPRSFSRTLGGGSYGVRGYSAAIGIGDVYSPQINSSALGQLDIQYGIRIEANAFGAAPPFNSIIDSAFNLRTDRLPRSLSLVPMAGFSRSFGTFTRSVGSRPSTRGTIFGGVREYHGGFSPSYALETVRHSGSVADGTQIACVGAAVPSPDWRAYLESPARIPQACVGAIEPALAAANRSVAVFSDEFQPETSWRAALGVSGAITRRFGGALHGTFAWNSGLLSYLDENLVRAPRFLLDGENRRPVFVSPSTIVGATGAMTSVDSRKLPGYGAVTSAVSDLRGHLWQINALITESAVYTGVPAKINSRESISYTFTQGYVQSRGIGGTTSGDPRTVERATSATSRHVITAGWSLTVPRWSNLGLSARVASGIRLTPLVASDINGDGLANDRAFVFDPLQTADSTLAVGIRSLLRHAPAATTRCLERQMQRIAGINSCEGPWFGVVNMSLSPDPRRLHLGNRGTLQLTATNVAGGLDQLFHGSQNLKGWGPSTGTNPILLFTRGFDPARKQFTYTVNQAFGGASSSGRLVAPFQLTIDARFYIGPDRESEFLLNYVTGASRSERLTDQEIRNQLARVPFTPFDQVLRLREAAHLSDEQTDSLQKLKSQYLTHHDSLMADLAAFLVNRRGDYRGEVVRTKWHAALVADQRWIYDRWPIVRRLLRPEQYTQLNETQRALWELSPAEFNWIMSRPAAIAR